MSISPTHPVRVPGARRTSASSLLAALALAGTLLGALPVGVAGAQPADTTRRSTRPLFTSRDAVAAGIFALGTIAAIPLDKVAARRLQNPRAQGNRFLRHQATNVRLVAEPGSLIIGGALYGAGRLSGNRRMADLGLHGTEAIGVGLGVVTVAKILAGRARPYVDVNDPGNFGFGRGLSHEEYRSFPSGHTVMAFSAAAAVTSETSRWWPQSRWYVGPVMYGGASLVGLSRMYNNKHWASDVLVGAAVGTFAGLKTVRYHHSHPGNRIDKWLLSGAIAPAPSGGYALSLTILPGLGMRNEER
ncbi:MAG TPA: phosphatase PAP2 family protein [Gemmatimonadaceae bacterium]|nr:phosphatase PAP2 family protein [Gemmatimonadaceae bacterium]